MSGGGTNANSILTSGISGTAGRSSRVRACASERRAPFLLGETQISRTPPGRRRVGFTLVEVIVVLVILAILAAIAIPALTGYIDKAQWAEKEAELRTIRTAVQTMIIEEMTANGGDMVTHDLGFGEGYFYQFRTVSTSAIAGITETLYSLSINMTNRPDNEGRAELIKLTADSGIVEGLSSTYIITSSSGAIKRIHTIYPNYFGTNDDLYVFWLADLPDTDPLMLVQKWSAEYGTVVLESFTNSTMTSGFNFYKYNSGTKEIEKL
jgi:prepilin-type N-terminal cleavage/methylation domain-containing protein